MRIAKHTVLWILVWIWMTSVYLYDYSDFKLFLLFNLTRLPVLILSTYAVMHFVVSKKLKVLNPDYTGAAILFILIFLSASILDRVVSGFDLVEPTLSGDPLVYHFFNPIAIFKNSFLLLSVLGIAASIQFFLLGVKQNKLIYQLREEKLETELAFLRSQVNPHFLFNAFNNLYSMAVREGNETLSKGLSGMAGLMRYLTYESQSQVVSVSSEIAMLQSYIELQRIRLGDEEDAFINFKTEGDFKSLVIAPVLLLPVIENAFKHGASPEQPMWIDILIQQDQDELVLSVKNKIINQDAENGGVGLDNLSKRLHLIYPNKYSLNISIKDAIFSVILKIDLSNQKNSV